MAPKKHRLTVEAWMNANSMDLSPRQNGLSRPRILFLGLSFEMFEQFRNFGTDESISYSFAGKERKFYVLNIGSQNIRQFQERVRALPDSLL